MNTQERMPWGKYRGVKLSDIPSSYLLWVLREADAAPPHLRDAIQDELIRRKAFSADGEDGRDAETLALPMVRSVIKSWYREMAKKYHPDRTLDDGSVMKAINDGYERLQKLFGVSK